jgi:hypothetical protein
MMVEKAYGRDFPLRQGARKSSGSFRSRDDDGGGLQYVSWKRDPSLRFFRRGELIGERTSSGDGPGRLTPGSAASVKIEGWAFVSSNSENISCVAFLITLRRVRVEPSRAKSSCELLV